MPRASVQVQCMTAMSFSVVSGGLWSCFVARATTRRPAYILLSSLSFRCLLLSLVSFFQSFLTSCVLSSDERPLCPASQFSVAGGHALAQYTLDAMQRQKPDLCPRYCLTDLVSVEMQRVQPHQMWQRSVSHHAPLRTRLMWSYKRKHRARSTTT